MPPSPALAPQESQEPVRAPVESVPETTLVTILAASLDRHVKVSELGFERLESSLGAVESAVVEQGINSRKDQRAVTLLLVLGLLAAAGVSVSSDFVNLTPGAQAQMQTTEAISDGE